MFKTYQGYNFQNQIWRSKLQKILRHMSDEQTSLWVEQNEIPCMQSLNRNCGPKNLFLQAKDSLKTRKWT